MRVCGNDDDDGHALYMCIIAATREKKSTGEHAQTQMYVFKKTTYHTVRFDRNRKKNEEKKTASSMTAWQCMENTTKTTTTKGPLLFFLSRSLF
jgi:hypothetical protein